MGGDEGISSAVGKGEMISSAVLGLVSDLKSDEQHVVRCRRLVWDHHDPLDLLAITKQRTQIEVSEAVPKRTQCLIGWVMSSA